MFGFWLGVVTGFAFLLLGLPLMGSSGDESPLLAMTIVVVAVMVIGAVVAVLQGQQGWHRTGIVGFIVGLPIGFVMTGLVLFYALLGAVGS